MAQEPQHACRARCQHEERRVDPARDERGLGLGIAQRQQGRVVRGDGTLGEEPERQHARAAALLADGQPPAPQIGEVGDPQGLAMEDPERLVEHGGQGPEVSGVARLRDPSLHEAHRRLAGHQPPQSRQGAGPGVDLQAEPLTAQQLLVGLRERIVGTALTAGGEDDPARWERTLEVIRRRQPDRHGGDEADPENEVRQPLARPRGHRARVGPASLSGPARIPWCRRFPEGPRSAARRRP
jgi:hypothetical protein